MNREIILWQYKAGNANREMQSRRYIPEHKVRKVHIWEIQIGRYKSQNTNREIQIGTYKSEHIDRTHINQKTKIERI